MLAVKYNQKAVGSLWKVSDLPEEWIGRKLLDVLFRSFSEDVENFQRKAGLQVDGMLGPITLTALRDHYDIKPTPKPVQSSEGLSALSLERLNTCDPLLQRLVTAVASERPIIVITGHRTEEEQNKAYRTGHSKLRWPYSKHNSFPSLAVDLALFPLNWYDIIGFRALAFHVKEKAVKLNIPINWGGDWKTFKDYGHYELRR